MKEITINIPITFRKVLDVNPSEVSYGALVNLILEQKNTLIQGINRNIYYQQEKLSLNKNRVFEVTETAISYLDKSRKARCYSIIEIADLESIIKCLQEPTEGNKVYLQNKKYYALILHSLAFVNQSDEFPWELYHALVDYLSL